MTVYIDLHPKNGMMDSDAIEVVHVRSRVYAKSTCYGEMLLHTGGRELVHRVRPLPFSLSLVDWCTEFHVRGKERTMVLAAVRLRHRRSSITAIIQNQTGHLNAGQLTAFSLTRTIR